MLTSYKSLRFSLIPRWICYPNSIASPRICADPFLSILDLFVLEKEKQAIYTSQRNLKMAAASSSSAPFFGRPAREENENQMIQQRSSTTTSSTVPTTEPQKKRRNQPGTPSKYLFVSYTCQFMYQMSLYMLQFPHPINHQSNPIYLNGQQK